MVRALSGISVRFWEAIAMLVNGKTVAFVPSSDLDRAERFYVGVLGSVRTSRDDFGLVVTANGVTIRIAKAGAFVPQPFTILGFDVDDIEKTVSALAAAGVAVERFPGMGQDDAGIWRSPSGSRVAWFKDLDGNVLSVAQHV
jgi:predicted enzyme related to lactoylglutathione lyase